MSERLTKRSENNADDGPNVSERPSKRARLSVEPEDTTFDTDSKTDVTNAMDLNEEGEESQYAPEETRASDLYLDTVGAFLGSCFLCAKWRHRLTGPVWILTSKRFALYLYPT